MIQHDIDNSFEVVDMCNIEGLLAIFVVVYFDRKYDIDIKVVRFLLLSTRTSFYLSKCFIVLPVSVNLTQT